MNLAKNFVKTICGNKDTVKVRWDLQRQNIRKHLWLTANSGRGGKIMKPQASYVLTAEEFELFVKTIETLKMPLGYSSTLGSIFGAKNLVA
jgi:hypothetical protein